MTVHRKDIDMTRFKIISNPYKKEIKYQQWDADNSAWVSIDLSDHQDTKLLSKEYTASFFPFKAKQIVTQIVEDYQIDGEEIELYFEGSADEYSELEAVCSHGEYDVPIKLTNSKVYLENARDILPEVKKLFQEMSPLIVQSVDQEKIERELTRFTDASSDVVPVCVLGNYSTGKSTFINALIGSEILPNGSNPVTAKVYKIARSKFKDRASIKLNYREQKIVLIMTADETHFENLTSSNDLTDLLTEQVISMADKSIVLRMNKAVSIINDFKNDEEDNGISDLIEIEIPFVNGVLGRSQHPFVLFDTPGSNSASNAKHLRVLKEAMANMTNGLPIFLATPDTLDSTDNENLYNMLNELDELDKRFTMIVVNKADKNDLNRKESSAEEEKLILRQAIPRHLYSAGIFYVSSIIGLGSKNGGEFLDDFYAETYEDQEHKYRDPENKRYKQLYTFDIMPFQIKQRLDCAAAKEQDLVYANSGLFSIETEIETFAGKYSAYNKCYQSQLFLYRIIELTQESIDSTKEETADTREMIKDKLESDKRALIDQLEHTANERKTAYQQAYEAYMQQFISGADETFSVDNLKQNEEEMTDQIEHEMGFTEHSEKTKESWGAVGQNLIHHVNQAFKEKSLDSVGNIFAGFGSDFNAAAEDTRAQNDLRKDIDKKVSDQLMTYARDKFKDSLLKVFESMDIGSQHYWTTNTEELRNILAQIVTGSDVLTADRRNELQRIIIEYKKLTFDVSHAESIFRKEEFEWKLAIGDFVVWHSDHLNLEKLAKTYNEHMSEDVQSRYKVIEESHRESAYQWIESLLDEIRTNIVEYSPELSKQARKIQTLTKQIEELIERQNKLKEYTAKLGSMMDWKVQE